MSNKQIANWIVPIVGHEFDMEDLPYWLAGYDFEVVNRKEGYCFQISKNNIGDDPDRVREYAECELELLNGAGRLLGQNFKPLQLADNFFGVDSSGDIVHTIVSVKTAEMRCKAGSIRAIVGGEPQPDPRYSVAIPLLNAAKISDQAYDALVICGRPKLTWTDLYLLFELVENSVGSRMYSKGWISKNKASIFTNTANSYSVLRHDSRHGKDKGSPPPKPMTLGEASGLIQKLVKAWLLHAGSQNND